MNNLLYEESKVSKQLMKLNTFYIDNYKNRELTITRKILHFIYSIFILIKKIVLLPKYGVAKTILNIRVLLNKKLFQDYTLKNDVGHENEINYKCKGRKINSKIAVYTSVFGNYDKIKEPLYVSNRCDYFAITDQDIPSDSVWKKIDCSVIEGFENLDNYHKSKFCKLFPHKILPNYEYSIWIDGNAQIAADVYPLVDRMKDSLVMASFQNPFHDCIYTERNYLIFIDAVDMKAIDRQMADYKNDGFPKKFGMREFTIIVRKHNDKKLQKYMEDWWEQVNKYTMRDQISFPYVLWKNGETIDYIQMYDGNWRDNPRFLYHDHSWRHKF